MRPERSWPGLLGVAVAIGLLGGALLAWATLTLSRTDIGGPGWSLRGNGALIVEFAAGPALLAGGWVFLARRRLGSSLIAAALTLAIELGIGFGPILAGPSAGPQTPLLVGLAAVVLALLAGLGLVWPPRRQDVLLGLAVVLLSVVLSLALPFLIFVLAPLLLPLVIAAPTFAHSAQRARISAAAVALPVTLIAATLAAQRLLAPA